MPVSPQDYALWSDITGNPYPQTPAERMALAPEVYSFTRDINQGRRPPGAIRRAVDAIGKTALAAGAVAGAVYLAKNFGSLELDDEPNIGPIPQPQGYAPASADITPTTTADRYGQDVVPHQTTVAQALRGTSPGKPTVVDSEQKPATQSHVISTSQTFTPGSEIDQLATNSVPHTPVRDRADDLVAEYLSGVAAEQRDQQRIEKSIDIHNAAIMGKMAPHIKQLNKEGREEGISPVGRSSVAAAERFRGTPAYTTMMQAAGASMEPEELVGAPGATPTFTEVRVTPQTRITPPAPTSAPTGGGMSAAVPAAFATPPRRSSAPADNETSALAAKALALLPKAQREALLSGQADSPIVTQQPETVRVNKPESTAKTPTGKEFLNRKIAGGMPQATPRGSAQQALAEASELYEGQLNPGKVVSAAEPASSFIEYVRMYPNDLMGVKLSNASIEYGHKVDPEFTPYLTEMIKRGEFYGADYNQLKALGVIKTPAFGHEKGQF